MLYFSCSNNTPVHPQACVGQTGKRPEGLWPHAVLPTLQLVQLVAHILARLTRAAVLLAWFYLLPTSQLSCEGTQIYK